MKHFWGTSPSYALDEGNLFYPHKYYVQCSTSWRLKGLKTFPGPLTTVQYCNTLYISTTWRHAALSLLAMGITNRACSWDRQEGLFTIVDWLIDNVFYRAPLGKNCGDETMKVEVKRGWLGRQVLILTSLRKVAPVVFEPLEILYATISVRIHCL